MARLNPSQGAHAHLAREYLNSARKLWGKARQHRDRGRPHSVLVLYAVEHASVAAEHAQYGTDVALLNKAVELGQKVQVDALFAMGTVSHPAHPFGVPAPARKRQVRRPAGLRVLKGGKSNPVKKKGKKAPKKKKVLNINDDDAVLIAVRLAQQGNKKAQAQIYSAYYKNVERVAQKCVLGTRRSATVGDLQDTADLTQNVFLKILESLPDFKFETKEKTKAEHPALMFKAYLHFIARRECYNWSRFGKRGVEKPGQLSAKETYTLHAQLRTVPIDLREAPAISISARNVAEAIRKSIAELSKSKRDLIVMADMRGMTAKQMGAETGVAGRTAADRLDEARKDLQKRVHKRLAPVAVAKLEGLSKEDLVVAKEAALAQLAATKAEIKALEGKNDGPGKNPRRRQAPSRGRRGSALRRLMRL